MNRKHLLTNAILWAAAIIASAIVGAPAILTLWLLPALWAGSFLAAESCGRQPDGPTAP